MWLTGVERDQLTRYIQWGVSRLRFFIALGCSAERWEVLCDDLLALARAAPRASEKFSPFGRIFEVDGILTGPLGRSADVRTVWIVGTMEDTARFVTAFPR